VDTGHDTEVPTSDLATDDALLALADSLAERAHSGQLDKAGAAYIGHPRRVAARVAAAGGTSHQRAAALLHDVLEDTDLTEADLHDAGIPPEVVEAVVALTRRPGEDHAVAVSRAAADPVAALVKRCDVRDNTDPIRLGRLDPATRRRLVTRYDRALAILDAAT
jgi:(p)ppGpp synthase/HD superfamily hydrolase